MTDTTTLLLNLINEGKNITEISNTMKMSHKQIYNIITLIKNKGFDFERKYYYNGDIIYMPKKKCIEDNDEGVNIITSPDDQKFEALVISDLHIGNIKERIDILNQAYDYCAKEGIHIILICGDIIEGMRDSAQTIHHNICEQIDYALKNYPFDNNILNFATLGDHDYDALQKNGQNLALVFESYRHDIIPLGYCTGQINIKNDKIIIKHPSDKFEELKSENIHHSLMLLGHSHQMKVQPSNDVTKVKVPTLSNLEHNGNITSSAIRIRLDFLNGMINYGLFTQLLFDKKIYTLSEFETYLGFGKDVSGNKPIKLEEDRTKKKILSNKNNQIEKFNSKWKKIKKID